MDGETLKVLGQIAGIGGIALGVLLLIFRDIIGKSIFPMLTKPQSYRLLRLVAVLTWSVAILGIGAWVWGENRPSGNGPEPGVDIETRGDKSPVVQGTDGDVTIQIGRDPSEEPRK